MTLSSDGFFAGVTGWVAVGDASVSQGYGVSYNQFDGWNFNPIGTGVSTKWVPTAEYSGTVFITIPLPGFSPNRPIELPPVAFCSSR